MVGKLLRAHSVGQTIECHALGFLHTFFDLGQLFLTCNELNFMILLLCPVSLLSTEVRGRDQSVNFVSIDCQAGYC